MDDQRKATGNILTRLGLFLSTCISAVGLAGMIAVVRMGGLFSSPPSAHTTQYQQGWSLFFTLMIGLPSLAAFLLGLAPWLAWFLKRGKK